MRSGSLIGTLHTPVSWVYRSGTIIQAEHDLYEFSPKYTTYFPMGIYVYGSIYSRSSTLARRD